MRTNKEDIIPQFKDIANLLSIYMASHNVLVIPVNKRIYIS